VYNLRVLDDERLWQCFHHNCFHLLCGFDKVDVCMDQNIVTNWNQHNSMWQKTCIIHQGDDEENKQEFLKKIQPQNCVRKKHQKYDTNVI
jgi:hypothetical protein